jgi:hypothetical protein
VIVGGESGPKARPCHPDWLRSVRDQCVAAGVPFLFKQHGEWAPVDDDTPRGASVTYVHPDGYGTRALSRHEPGCPCDHDPRDAPMAKVGKKASGRVLDGKVWDEFPETRKAVARA